MTAGARPIGALLLVCAMAAGCVNLSSALSPSPDTSRFFSLTPVAEPQAAAANSAGNGGLSVGIGPIGWPAYLDREELVIRRTQTRMDVSENDRWIEPLEENFASVLAQNLAVLLPGARILRYPWRGGQRPAYQLDVEVIRFEPNSARDVQLSARWALIDTKTRRAVAAKESQLTRSAGGAVTEASVMALSEVLGDFSREVAAAVRSLDDPAKPAEAR